jgi:DNA helicase-2/ATP-dependent DNA helicase PcrA
MSEIKEIFTELNALSEHNIKNDLAANKARKIFERALKLRLGIPRNNNVSIKMVFDEYVEKFKPEGIKYNGIELIKELNKFSHDTSIKLSNEKLKDYLSKLNMIFEVMFETTNNKIIPSELIPNINNDCNTEQLAAIESDGQITLVQAGPGTGKTYLIVERIIRIGNNSSNKRVIGLSFTNQAATNLKQRFEYKIFGTRQRSNIRKKIFIGTIHSFAFDSLKSFHANALNEEFEYSIIDEEEFKEIRTEFNNNTDIINNYLKEHKLLTFQDILEEFKKRLLNDHNFKKYVAENIQEIIIDEAQDLDKIQYEIFKELQSYTTSPRLFLVGDQRQNIFDFAGGNLKYLLNNFEESKIQHYSLIKSYRCPNKVLEFVNSFTFNDCDNIALTNKTFIGEDPILEECSDKRTEANSIVSKISNNQNEKPLSEIAILTPSSFYFTEIANRLNEVNLPFRIFGGETTLKPQMRFLLNVLKAINSQKKYPLLKVISFWDSKAKISSEDFYSILLKFDTEEERLKQNNKLYSTIKFIRNNIEQTEITIGLVEDFINFCNKYNIFGSQIIELYSKFYELLIEHGVNNIDEINMKLTPNNNEFSLFYNKTANIKCIIEVGDKFITLSTIHSAKGKEWDYVFIPGLTQDIFPKFNSDYNAELKKFYVACTRAKKRLFLLRPKTYSVTKKDGSGFWTFTKPKSVFLKGQYQK